jgi:hypothetical protein
LCSARMEAQGEGGRVRWSVCVVAHWRFALGGVNRKFEWMPKGCDNLITENQ